MLTPIALSFPEAIYLTGVAGAGFPSPAQDWEETRINLMDWIAPDRPSAFSFRIDGASMRDAGLFDGDVVVVDRALKPRQGAIVVAAFEDGFVCRQVVVRGDEGWLEARNGQMRIAPIRLDETVEIFGCVRAVVRRLAP